METNKEKVYKVIKLILIITYFIALPYTAMLALFWPLTIGGVTNGNLIFVIVIFLYSIPFIIFTSLIKILYDKSKSIFWFLLPIIMFILLIGLDMFSGYYTQKEYQAQQPIPFSQRGLPVPKTDVPVVLPPDPGEAGKATLAGIDSNHDGVRDDLEREIVYMYPQNDQVRRVLRAMVKKDQQLITTSGDTNWFEKLWAESAAFGGCSDYMVFGNEPPNLTNYYILHNMELNTSKRKEKYNENLKSVNSPGILTGKEVCDSELVKNQY